MGSLITIVKSICSKLIGLVGKAGIKTSTSAPATKALSTKLATKGFATGALKTLGQAATFIGIDALIDNVLTGNETSSTDIIAEVSNWVDTNYEDAVIILDDFTKKIRSNNTELSTKMKVVHPASGIYCDPSVLEQSYAEYMDKMIAVDDEQYRFSDVMNDMILAAQRFESIISYGVIV